MRRVVLLVAFAALLVPATAAAHPLGNFTINRFARIEVAGHTLYVRYVLDLAEIPTYQARQQGVDAGVYGRRIASNLRVTLGGRRARLVPVARALAFPLGQGGLHTMRLEVVLRGPRVERPVRLELSDANYAGRVGWKEIVVGADTRSISDELHAYPRNLLQSPLDETHVTTVVRPTHDAVPSVSHGPQLVARDRAVADQRFARLVERRRLGVLVVIASLALALFWGAAHALTPGHGKTIVAAYLVGSRGTPRHAALLGLTVTVTHTIGVFALGLVTLALSQWVVPEQLYPWLNLVSGLLVVGVGVSVLRARWRRRDAREHSHDHDHPHAHTPRDLLAVGISGGLLPCPSALVVLLGAIALHRVAFGLLLIVAFSLGLALAITGVGIAAVLARRSFARWSAQGRVIRVLPALSAVAIVAAGVVMTVHALPRVH
jgi:ABC-type nickel/cobalt efflux system permease component RcnA